MQPLSDADLRLVRVFKTVADNGGFAASEVALNKSKSAISVDLSNLERRFGMRLCERGRTGFALTAQGEAVYEAAETLLQDLDRFSAKVAAAASELFGRVTLAVIDNIGSIAAEPMIAAIRAFRTQHPQVQLSIQSGSALEVERAVLDRTAQVGISILPRLLPELETELLFTEGQILYCSRAHPLFALDDADITPERLADFPLISLPVRDPAEAPARRGFRRGAEADNLDCLILVILAGVDLGFLPPHYAHRWVESGDLRAIQPSIYRDRKDFHLLSLRSTWAAPTSLALIKLLSEAVAEHPVEG